MEEVNKLIKFFDDNRNLSADPFLLYNGFSKVCRIQPEKSEMILEMCFSLCQPDGMHLLEKERKNG